MTDAIQRIVFALLLSGCLSGQAGLFFSLPVWAAVGIDTVSDTVLAQSAETCKERCDVLWEGDHVLSELVQAGPLNGYVRHLQMFKCQ